MSGRKKTRKNAGEGYGYMFHGAFKEKKDAMKKERKTKGAWVKGVLTNQGHRYLVMSPRTNPIKRKKKAKNPHELLVMGANPDRYTSAHAAASGAAYTPPGLIQTKGQKRVAAIGRKSRKHKYDWIPEEGVAPGQNPHQQEIVLPANATIVIRTNPEPRRNVELGTYENGVFHPWTRRPKSRQKKAIRRQNPSAADIREDFVGKRVGKTFSVDEPHMPAGDYAQLGSLLALYVKPAGGGQVLEIAPGGPRHNPDSPARPRVVSDETARQIYFVGGDQDLSKSLQAFGAIERAPGLYEIGEARRIDYQQRKEHVPDPEIDQWRHEFGEETGVRPTVLYDARHKRLLLEGGQYEVRPEGIVN